jgi:hypothetical protein
MLVKGLQLLIGDGGSPTEVFTAITGRTETEWDGRTWETEETTNNDSTTPVTSRSLTVATDGNFTLVYKPWNPSGNVQHALLETLSRTGDARNFKLSHPGSSIGVMGPFEACVMLNKKETPTKGIYAARIQLMPTGAIADALPTLASVTVTDGQAGAYVTTEVIELTATFDEVVKVTGTPRIAITLQSGTVYANYATGTGTNVLKFRHTVVGGDSAGAGQMSIATSISLNGGTIKDMLDQAPASLSFTPPTTSSFTVN